MTQKWSTQALVCLRHYRSSRLHKTDVRHAVFCNLSPENDESSGGVHSGCCSLQVLEHETTSGRRGKKSYYLFGVIRKFWKYFSSSNHLSQTRMVNSASFLLVWFSGCTSHRLSFSLCSKYSSTHPPCFHWVYIAPLGDWYLLPPTVGKSTQWVCSLGMFVRVGALHERQSSCPC